MYISEIDTQAIRRNKKMKKILCTIISVTLLLGLCGCSKDNKLNKKIDGPVWYVDDYTAEELADIAYSYVSNLPKKGMTADEYYASFLNNTEYKPYGWEKDKNEIQIGSMIYSRAGISYTDVTPNFLKDRVEGLSLKNLWIDEDFKYAGSAYENIGDEYQGEKTVELKFTFAVSSEKRAGEIIDAYLKKYGSRLGAQNEIPEYIPCNIFNSKGNVIADIDNSTMYLDENNNTCFAGFMVSFYNYDQ